jgi:hypothetical protein
MGAVEAGLSNLRVTADAPDLGCFDGDRPDALARSRIAVLVPCYNEETAIAQVVRDFRAALPRAAVYVYDNNSRDRTTDVARSAGAIVRREAPRAM